jgi:hypothetical protein
VRDGWLDISSRGAVSLKGWIGRCDIALRAGLRSLELVDES